MGGDPELVVVILTAVVLILTVYSFAFGLPVLLVTFTGGILLGSAFTLWMGDFNAWWCTGMAALGVGFFVLAFYLEGLTLWAMWEKYQSALEKQERPGYRGWDDY